jgi:hypothetical protein
LRRDRAPREQLACWLPQKSWRKHGGVAFVCGSSRTLHRTSSEVEKLKAWTKFLIVIPPGQLSKHLLCQHL